jgi:hypothetical protein
MSRGVGDGADVPVELGDGEDVTGAVADAEYRYIFTFSTHIGIITTKRARKFLSGQSNATVASTTVPQP